MSEMPRRRGSTGHLLRRDKFQQGAGGETTYVPGSRPLILRVPDLEYPGEVVG